MLVLLAAEAGAVAAGALPAAAHCFVSVHYQTGCSMQGQLFGCKDECSWQKLM